MNRRIPLFRIYWEEDDLKAVDGVLRMGEKWAIGDGVEHFEKELAEYHGTRYCVVFNSGTSALHAVMLACGIGPGDEVIVPSFTFISTANAPLFVGARPVFADIEKTTCGLDPEDTARKITPKTRAIIPVHYGGCPCLIGELSEIAQKHNLLLIEDAAEALGASIGGRKVGTYGDAAVLSFCQNKVITTGEGGAVITDSQEVYEKLKLIRSHGKPDYSDYFSSTDRADYIALGYNFRMSNITAALGRAQLDKADKIIEMRREKAHLMSQKLASIGGVAAPSPPDGFYHVYQMYTIRVGNNLRDRLLKHLESRGIMTKVYFPPVHQTPYYQKELGYNVSLPVTEAVSGQVLTLPMYPNLSKEEIATIADEIARFFREVP